MKASFLVLISLLASMNAYSSLPQETVDQKIQDLQSADICDQYSQCASLVDGFYKQKIQRQAKEHLRNLGKEAIPADLEQEIQDLKSSGSCYTDHDCLKTLAESAND